jgi:hypothetical protein
MSNTDPMEKHCWASSVTLTEQVVGELGRSPSSERRDHTLWVDCKSKFNGEFTVCECARVISVCASACLTSVCAMCMCSGWYV